MVDVRNAEGQLEQRRDVLREALRAAHKAGASYALLGRVVGLTRQRVARIVEEDSRRVGEEGEWRIDV